MKKSSKKVGISSDDIIRAIIMKKGSVEEYAKEKDVSSANIYKKAKSPSVTWVSELVKEGILHYSSADETNIGNTDFVDSLNGETDMIMANASREVKIIQGEKAKEYLAIIRNLLKAQDENVKFLKEQIEKKDNVIEKLLER